MEKNVKISRREFIKVATLGVGATVLTACGVDTKPTAAPATAVPPTQAPAAPPTSVPPTAVPATKAPAPTAAPTKVPTLGDRYIGKLEGSEVVVNAAKPAKLSEAPMLADLVKAGKLPPVEQRVPDEPCVVKPLNEVGKYGGTWRRAFIGAADGEAANRMVSIDKWIFWDYTGAKLIPSLAKAWKLSDDGKRLTIYLRKGLKWSDGKPYTADDCVFWFEDMNGNKELKPVPEPTMSVGGKPGKLVKIDDYTIEWQFEVGYWLFELILAGDTSPGRGQSAGQWRGDYNGGYAPKHYLSQFLPKYKPQAELDAAAKAAGYDNWKARFEVLKNWMRNPDLPCVQPWKVVAGADLTKPLFVLERNPYHWEVDTAGNQLPYIDKVQFTGENVEVVNLRAIAGEYDNQERHLQLTNLPVFIENQQKGGYTVRIDPGSNGGDANILFNFAYREDPEVAKWINNKDFRRALSLGVDRDQINEAIFLGLGVVGSPIPEAVMAECPQPEAEWRKKWHVLDIAQSNALLDKVGLDKKDSEGYRLRSDGKGRLRLEVLCQDQIIANSKIGEMLVPMWKKIGIQLDPKVVDTAASVATRSANKEQLSIWTNNGSDQFFLYARVVLPIDATANNGIEVGKWYATKGAQGIEPMDPDLKKCLELNTRAQTETLAERNKIAQEIWKLTVDAVISIGTVGQSPASLGLRLVKNNIGNAVGRQCTSQHARTPSAARPTAVYFKS